MDDERTLLGLLLDDPARHFSADELAREFDWPAFRVEDALAGLQRAGLTHRHGDFAWASRAAVRAAELV
jgi:hypothetical protein